MLKKIFTLLLCCSIPCWSAISFDTSVDGGECDLCGTQTWSHTLSTNPNNALIVCLEIYQITPPTVTYAGQSLTQIAGINSSGNYNNYIFYGVGLPTGPNNVVVTSPSSYILGASASFTGVNQSLTPDNTATNTGTGGTASVTIVPNSSNDFAVDCLGVDFNFTIFPTGGWTTTQNIAGSADLALAVSYIGPVSSSQTNSYTFSATSWGDIAMTMAPAATATVPSTNEISINGAKVSVVGGKISIK